jgi:hypothetical protein
MTAQALLGQTYTSHTALWASLDERREVLNHHLPNRALSQKPPLEAYPGAIHSGRSYRASMGRGVTFTGEGVHVPRGGADGSVAFAPMGSLA